MSLTRSNLGTVPFSRSLPKNSSVKKANEKFVSLSPQEKSELHQDFQDMLKNIPNINHEKKNSFLPFTLGIAGIAGVSLLFFGYGTLGFCAVSATALYGLIQLNSSS
jgi:hypothetical protein